MERSGIDLEVTVETSEAVVGAFAVTAGILDIDEIVFLRREECRSR